MSYQTGIQKTLKGVMVAMAMAGLTSGAYAQGVKLTLWHNTADPPHILKMYKDYEAASGNTLELVPMPADGFETATLTRWATGERPDIMEYHGGTSILYQFNAMENMRDLSAEPVLQNGSPIYQAMGVVDGKRYAVTVGYPSVFGLYYNKDVLSKNGIAPPTTFDELVAACAALKEKDPSVAAVFEAGGSKWPTQILPYLFLSQYNVDRAYSVAVTERKQAVTDPEGPLVKALEAYAQLRDSGCFNTDAVTAKFEDSFAALAGGKAAFVAQHSSMLPTLDAAAGGDKAKVDATIGFTPISLTQAGAWFGASPLGTYYLPKTGDATREEAALGFIRYITGEGYNQYVVDSGEPPVLAGGAMPELRPLLVEINGAYEKGVPGLDVTGWTNFDQLMGRLLSKQLTPQEVADQLAITIEQQSKAAGLPGW